jgi:hypothetical protein
MFLPTYSYCLSIHLKTYFLFQSVSLYIAVSVYYLLTYYDFIQIFSILPDLSQPDFI